MMQAVRPSSKKNSSCSLSTSGNNSQTKQGGSTGKSIAQRVMDMTTSSPNGDSLRQQQQQQQNSSNNSVENDHEVETITNRLSHITTSNISPVNSQTSSSNNVNSSGSNSNSNNNNNQCDVMRASSQSSLQHQRQQKHLDLPANICISLDTRVPHPHAQKSAASAFSYQPGAAGQLTSSSQAGRLEEAEEVSYYNDAPNPIQQSESAACLLEPKQVGGSLDNSSKPRALLLAASSAIRDQKLGSSACHMGATSCQQLAQQQRHRNHTQQQHTHHLHHLGHLPLVPQQANLIEPPEAPPSHHHYDDVTYDLRYDNALVIEKEAARLHRREPSAGAGSSRYQEIPDLVCGENFVGAHEEQDSSGRQDKSATTEQDSTTCQHSSSAMSIAASAGCTGSPKAKSAPATPCNVTPSAFHQSHHQPAGQAHQNPNTMPPDMRKNISSAAAAAASNRGRLLPAISMQSAHPNATPYDQQQHQQHLELAELAMREKDYKRAVELFSECILFASDKHDKSALKRFYVQRAEAHFQLAQYNEAIEDSMSARDLNPKWTQPYYLQGRSQFMIGRYADSLAVFSFGLTQEPQNEQLFKALIEAALNSKAGFGKEFELKFNRLKALGLESRPFLVVSLLGQEMLARGHCEHAAITLESALKLLASSSSHHQHSHHSHKQQRKLKSSVLSSIASAFCALRDYDKAIAYMHKELEIERELEHVLGQCRVLANLGQAYYKVRKFDESLRVHREQLDLALKNNLPQQAYQALHAAGHLHAIKGDYLNAMQSHEYCVNLTQDPNLMAPDKRPYAQFRELLSVGYLHAQSNNLKGAEDRYIQASELLKPSQLSQEQLVDGKIMVNFNLAYLALKRQTRDAYQKAKYYYTSVLEEAQKIKSDPGSGSNNKSRARKRAIYEMRACHGLGQTCRLLRELDEARGWFEKQLRLAETLKNIVGQSQALCNLGLLSQHSDQPTSWKLFEKNLHLVKGNKLLKAYALSYMGLAYAQRGRQRESKDFYENSLSLFKALGYCEAEQKTIEENIAAVH